MVDYGDLETNLRNRGFFDLSHIPDEQKYLKVIPSDKDDSMKLKTRGGNEYFVKLKELEMNNKGECVITLEPIAKKLFYINNQRSISNNYSLNNIDCSTIKDFSECDENLTNLEQKSSNRGFVQINTALSDILTNLKCKTTGK